MMTLWKRVVNYNKLNNNQIKLVMDKNKAYHKFDANIEGSKNHETLTITCTFLICIIFLISTLYFKPIIIKPIIHKKSLIVQQHVNDNKTYDSHIDVTAMTQTQKKKWQKAYNYLQYTLRPWYASGVNKFCKITNMSYSELNDISYPNGTYSNAFRHQFNDDWINIFAFKDVTYVGLQSRKIDYDKDKENGTNIVEQRIQNGYYDHKRKRKRRKQKTTMR
eukprot:290358_1